MGDPGRGSQASSRAPGRSSFAIVLFALLIRLAIVWAAVAAHPPAWFFAQASELGALAENLRNGHGLSSPFGGITGPSAFLTPGYPALIAGIFACFGAFSRAAEIAIMSLQALFGAGTVLVLTRFTGRLFGSRAAIVAGVVWAVSPATIFLPTLFWETSLSILLAISAVAVTRALAENPKSQRWLLAGLLAAVALLVNPSLLPILLCCFGWACLQLGKRSLPGALLALATLLSVWTPWIVRNHTELHAFIPLRSNLGYELWQGNRPGSDGFFEPALHPNTDREEFREYSTLGEVVYMARKKELAQAYIKANRLEFVQLSARRVVNFWTGTVRHASALVVGYITVTTMLGAWGLVRMAKKDGAMATLFLLPLLLFPLPYYLTHPDFRFRLVLDPMMVALAAGALTSRKAEPAERAAPSLDLEHIP